MVSTLYKNLVLGGQKNQKSSENPGVLTSSRHWRKRKGSTWQSASLCWTQKSLQRAKWRLHLTYLLLASSCVEHINFSFHSIWQKQENKELVNYWWRQSFLFKMIQSQQLRLKHLNTQEWARSPSTLHLPHTQTHTHSPAFPWTSSIFTHLQDHS